MVWFYERKREGNKCNTHGNKISIIQFADGKYGVMREDAFTPFAGRDGNDYWSEKYINRYCKIDSLREAKILRDKLDLSFTYVTSD